jgi:hypothetical protein
LLVYKRFRDLHQALSCLLIFKSSSSSPSLIFGYLLSIDQPINKALATMSSTPALALAPTQSSPPQRATATCYCGAVQLEMVSFFQRWIEAKRG